MKGINYRNVGTLVLAAGLMVGSVAPVVIQASEVTGYILETRYTENRLLEGDSFGIQLDFSTTEETTTIQSVEVSGEAVDTADYRYDILNPVTGNYKDGPIGRGELVTLDLRGLEYTGKGDTVDVVIKHTGGTVRQTVTLDTMTTEEVKGALLLDPTVASNMSVTLEAGESKQMSLTIKNTSEETIKNSIVKINLAKTTVGLAITDGQYIEIDSLGAGKSKTIEFVVEASEDVVAGTYEIKAEINGMAQTILLEVANDETPPVIEMQYAPDQVFEAGAANPLTLVLTNAGDDDAYNVKLHLQSTQGVGLVGTSSVISVGTLAAGTSDQVDLTVQLDESKEGQLVNVPFKLTYTTKQGETIEEVQEVYLSTTEDATEDAQVLIGNVKVSTTTVGENEAFAITFDILADTDAEGVKVSVNTPEGILATSQNMFMFDTLVGGQPQTLTVQCLATDAAKEGYQPIELVVEYDYEGGKQQTTQYTGVNSVQGEASTAEAKVIVTGYDVTPGTLTAGAEGEIQIRLTNTHATETVQNLTATYTTNGDTQVIQPVGSGNTLYTATIQPGETVTQTLKFKVAKDAESKDYQLNAQLNYETGEGTKLEAQQTVIVPVSEEGVIQVGDLGEVSLIPGKASALTIPLYNRGNVDLENAMIYLEGEGFTVKDNELYISSFAKGGTEYYLPTITPQGADISVNLVAEYENAEGILEKTVYPLGLEMPSEIGMTGAGGGMAPAEGAGMMSGMTSADKAGRQAAGKAMGAAMGVAEAETETTPTWVVGVLTAIGVAGSFVLYKVLRKRKKLKGLEQYENL